MNFQSSTSGCPAFPSTVCRWSCLFSGVCFWHLRRQLAEDAELISGTVFYLTDLSICSCASIAPFLTIAQRGVLKPGTMTLQLYPFHSRLFGPLCFRRNLRIFFFSSVKHVSVVQVKATLALWMFCVVGFFRQKVLLICEHGRPFHLSVTSNRLVCFVLFCFELCNFHWRVLSHP